MNRLASATSPYLLQHADNPVDWWQWGEEAFAEAVRRDVPVLLSVGYAACHWCHVMAHESFEDAETAALMNEHLVSIKVDREERPDVDSVYMTATQAMIGQGGWPMTVFMTPDREPFVCGTYFPRPQFQQLIRNVSQAWRDQRDGVTGQAKQITQALTGNAEAVIKAMRSGAGTSSWTAVADQAVAGLRQTYDAANGGFGGAPKFPPSMVLEFLLRYHERTGDPAAWTMAEGTLQGMARGGMFDQIGGGFARYSVDAGWVVPHFEKMLYDNALLTRAYLHYWRRSDSDLGRRVAAANCLWMMRELQTEEGGFAASLDADSEGEEGKYYVWRPEELTEILGPEDGEFAAEMFGVTPKGTFEHGTSVLQLRSDPADPVAGEERLARIRGTLWMARNSRRVRPARDDKVVAAWNGLAISAFAETGLLLRRPELVKLAIGAAHLLADRHVVGGRLMRTSRDGVAGDTAGALDDYACVAQGYLTLSGVTGDPLWVALAGKLLDTALDLFADGAGGFYDSPADGEQLIFRPADPADNATPSGAFAMADALLSYSALTGSARHREAAEAALGVVPAITARFPRAAGTGLAVVEALIAGPAEIAIIGDEADSRTTELQWTAMHAAPPGAVLAWEQGFGGLTAPEIPLVAGKEEVDGQPTAYVCRNFTCLAPVTSAEELRSSLARS
jgi:uncharacterized protein